jgi:hypothetical protein
VHTFYENIRSWYKRSEFGLRIAIFFSAATVSGAFGGLLAVCRLLTRNAERLIISAGCNLGHERCGWKSSLVLDFQFVSPFLRSLAVKPIISVVLEGLVTFLAGAASFWIIQDFPDTAKFLTEAERTVVIRRLQVDDQFSAGGEKFKTRYIFKSLADWKTWVASGLPVTFLG